MTLSEISFASVQNAMASAYMRGNPLPAAPVRATAESSASLVVGPAAEVDAPAYPDHKGSLISIRA